jgi:hypothetical protein
MNLVSFIIHIELYYLYVVPKDIDLIRVLCLFVFCRDTRKLQLMAEI